MNYAMTLREKAANLVQNQREILDRASKENRHLTQMECETIDKYDVDIDKFFADAKRAEAVEARALLDHHTNNPAPANAPERRMSVEQLASMGRREVRKRDEYKENYRAFILGHDYEKRTLRTDDNINGGFLLAPMQMSDQLITNVDNLVFMRKLGKVEKTKGAVSLGIPSREVRASQASWTSELPPAATPDSTLQFGRRELYPRQLMKEIDASIKWLLNSTHEPEELINDEISYIVGITLENAYLNGTGANQPLGIFVASNMGIDTSRDVVGGTNTGTITSADCLFSAYYNLKPQYRQSKSLRWMFHRNRVADLRKIKDNYGQYLWVVSLQQGSDGILLNTEVISSELAPTSTSLSAYWGVIGDFGAYYMADADEYGLQRLGEIKIRQGIVCFLYLGWHDGMPGKAEAFSRLQYPAS